MTKTKKRRNPVAARLSRARFQPKQVIPRKGKGSYKRRSKHPQGVGRRFFFGWIVDSGTRFYSSAAFAGRDRHVLAVIPSAKHPG